MIGIFIGIATVVSLISLGAGLKASIAAQFSTLGTDRLIVQAKGGGFGPPGQGTAVELTTKDLSVVQNSRYVSLAAGRNLEPIQVKFNDKIGTTFLASIPETTKERDLVLSIQNVKADQGRLPRKGDGYSVAVGSQFTTADKFGKPLRVGDTLYINGKKANVVGILTRRGTPQIDGAMLMSESSMRDLLGIEDKYSLIVAQATSNDDVTLAKETIEKNLRSSRGVPQRKEDFTVQTPQGVLDSFNSIITAVTAVLVGIAGISLVVGGIGITNTMYTAVLERTREIGIMKAVGARNSDVLAIFLFESGLLGLTGGAIGLAIGIIFSKLVEFVGTVALGSGILRAEISVPLMISSLLFSFLVGALAGTLPAYEASKLPPVEALRQ